MIKWAVDVGEFNEYRLRVAIKAQVFGTSYKRWRQPGLEGTDLDIMSRRISLNRRVPREENGKADHLSKVASSAKEGDSRKITILTDASPRIGVEVMEIEEGDD
ncbi:hypothetical protein DH2020_023382 [Rehmannia glutinosa]|uniref:Uncharacterized protein n=1 Tax=Rehmannia glutinosa TaxID=99300 RepID=A0ABR0W7N9_REHGL